MAKDDYNVVVFKILTYLYACLKRTTLFDERVFKQIIDKQSIPDEYLTDILRMMTEEDLITGWHLPSHGAIRIFWRMNTEI